MKITKQARREAKELFRSCMAGGRLDEARVRGIVQKVVQVKPRGYLAILTQFQRLVKLELDRISARVESAVPLGAALQIQVEANLHRIYGNNLRMTYVQNPQLLGGMRIRVGSDVYDGSVQSRLKQLQEKF